MQTTQQARNLCAILISFVFAASTAFASAPAAPSDCLPSTTTSFENTTSQPINDFATTTSTITVSGLDTYLWDVDLTTRITHTYNGDIRMTLTSPMGTAVTITSTNAQNNDNVFDGTLWDDDAGDTNAPGPVTDAYFTDNVVQSPLCPEQALGVFIGENPNGVWTLKVYDAGNDDSGSLNAWSLDLTTLPLITTTEPTHWDTFDVTNTAIPDAGTMTTAVTMSGCGTCIGDVQLHTSIEHTRCQDLDITLTSPAGTVVTITTNNGGDYDDVFSDTHWIDRAGSFNAPGSITDTAFEDGVAESYVCPEEPMAAFNGEDPNGTWTLTIEDDLEGETGTLKVCQLGITTVTYPDSDGDGVPDACDQCRGYDDTVDTDSDGVADGCDQCPGFDDAVDTDGDGVADGCDKCAGFDDSEDADSDGVPDACDQCAGSDDNVDTDGDGVPDGCDQCPGSDDAVDTDGDGVADGCDKCAGFDDSEDADSDGVPDACDQCPGFDDSEDADSDGVPDACDQCAGSDDNVDTDGDGVPDGCDKCAGSDDNVDTDGDGVADGCDKCAGSDDAVDTDGDGVPDGCDQCPGSDDNVDTDGDGVADGCDQCPNDPNKVAPGDCGCGVVDTDSDGNGVSDCLDSDTPGGQDNPETNEGDDTGFFWPLPFCGIGTATCLPLMVAGLGLMRHSVRRRRRK